MKSNLNDIKCIYYKKTEMKKHLAFSLLLIAIIFYSCKKNELPVNLSTNEDLSFSGTFKTINSENLSGTVILNISKGHYECLTNLPYGHGAGKLETTDTTINFKDTLFFPMLAIFGPSYVLSGKHYYKYDGKNLKIWRDINIGSIEYNLRKVKTN